MKTERQTERTLLTSNKSAHRLCSILQKYYICKTRWYLRHVQEILWVSIAQGEKFSTMYYLEYLPSRSGTSEGLDCLSKHNSWDSRSLSYGSWFFISKLLQWSSSDTEKHLNWEVLKRQGYLTLIHCWWEYKLVQPLWKTVWRFLKKLRTYDVLILLLGIYPKKTKILI